MINQTSASGSGPTCTPRPRWGDHGSTRGVCRVPPVPRVDTPVRVPVAEPWTDGTVRPPLPPHRVVELPHAAHPEHASGHGPRRRRRLSADWWNSSSPAFGSAASTATPTDAACSACRWRAGGPSPPTVVCAPVLPGATSASSPCSALVNTWQERRHNRWPCRRLRAREVWSWRCSRGGHFDGQGGHAGRGRLVTGDTRSSTPAGARSTASRPEHSQTVSGTALGGNHASASDYSSRAAREARCSRAFVRAAHSPVRHRPG